MKGWITALILTGAFCSFAETLTIKVTTEGPREGVIAILIFNNKKGWPGKDKLAFRKLRVPVTREGEIECTVTNLPHGIYSLSILHDVNDNYKSEKLLGFGPPTEPVGFSNIPERLRKKPKFEDTLITFSATNTEHKVNLFHVF